MKRAVSIRLAIAVMAFCLPLIPNSASAQQEKGKESVTTEQKPLVAYRIEFNVREIEDGKRLNSRNYMMVVRDGFYARIRVGNRVPTVTDEKKISYQDVGMNIDCEPFARDDKVELIVVVELSSVAAQDQQLSGSSNNPVFRQQRSTTAAVLTPGKPTVVASMDDVLSNRRYEIEVTATKVK